MTSCAVVATVLGAVMPAPAVDASSLVRLAGSVPPVVTEGLLHPVPTPRSASGTEMTLTVTLKRSNQAGFERYLSAVEDPASLEYRHFLSQAQLTAAFGPSKPAYDAVRSWLTSEGFSVVQGSADRLTLTIRGTRALVEAAFKAPINNYAVGSRTVFANSTDVMVPASLAGSIQSVSGLSDVAAVSAPLEKMDPAQSKAACLSALQAAAGAVVDPSTAGAPDVLELLRTALSEETASRGLLGLFTLSSELLETSTLAAVGVGAVTGYCLGLTMGTLFTWNPTLDPPEKIGLLEYDTYRPSDVTDWLKMLGFNPSVAGMLSEVPVNGGVSAPGAGQSEVLLDIDTLLGLIGGSPNTHLVVYDAPPSTSFEAMFNAMIGDGDTIISNSWAQCEDETSPAEVQAINSVLAQAAGSGITVINGSGDSGSTCLDGSANTVAVPADSPNATSVGGTTVRLGPGLTFAGESYWNDSSATPPGGSGGFGVSKYFARPSYQDSLTSASGRSVPDLAVDANPRGGIEICEADAGGCPTGLLYGGTSMAAPELAADVYVLDQALGSNVGNLNALLYPLAGTSAFRDASALGTDFAHVGLGDPNWQNVILDLTHQTVGGVDASTSLVGASTQVPADGRTQATVRVDLRDAHGFPVAGRTVSLSTNGGCGASISAASGASDAISGSVTFAVTDTTPETCTFTATDTTDHVPLDQTAIIAFVAPSATDASIEVSGPNEVSADGTSQATIEVYLENGLGQPASGKTVQLIQNGSAAINQPSGQATTGANGIATFTVTDSTPESVLFSATDLTDGNLPVPGNATVTYYTGTPPSCPDFAASPASGYSAVNFANGFPYNPEGGFFESGVYTSACTGVDPPVFDASGNLWAPDFHSGTVNVLPPGGAAPGLANQLPGTTFGANDLYNLAFGKHGSLYALLGNGGSGGTGAQVVQLAPQSGAVVRVVAGNLPDCASDLAVDPLSGDLFLDGTCNGSDYTGEIARVEDPSGASPTVVDYATLPGGLVPSQIAFAPNGTLYVVGENPSFRGPSYIYQVDGTGTSQPVPTPSDVTQYTTALGIGLAVAASNPSGQATALYASDDAEFSAGAGHIYRIDLTQSPPAVSPVLSPSASGGDDFAGLTMGPDGCLYVAATSFIERLGTGTCGQSGNVSRAPSLTLTSDAGTLPPTGTDVSFTATLANVSNPGGTGVTFAAVGANILAGLVDAGTDGSATFSYAALHPGTDRVEAVATVGGQTLVSNPVALTWVQGRDTAFLSMNQSPEAGTIGTPVTLQANLSDVSLQTPSPIVGAHVTLTLGSQSCGATTDSSGNASCSVTPTGPAGLTPMGASYPGSSQYTAATATAPFDLVPAVARLTPFTLGGIAPDSGPTGTQVALSGSGFGTVAGSVYFTQGTTTLQQSGSHLTSWSDGSVATTVPSGLSAGTVELAVYNPTTGLLSNALPFSVTAPPVLASVSPSSGPVDTGVTLSGSGFGTVAGSVYFTQGSTTLVQTGGAITAWSEGSVETAVPGRLSPGSVSVAVYSATSGLMSNTSPFTVTAPAAAPPAAAGGGGGGGGGTFSLAPVVSGLSPGSGPAAGGTSVTVAGSRFTGATAVSFGGTAATSFTVDSDSQITATAPAGTGTVDVTVTTAYGTSGTTFADRFTYTAAVAQAVPAAPSAPTFSDVPSTYWAYAQIEALAAKGIVGGFPDGTFRPDAALTRAQFVKMLDLTLGLTIPASPTATAFTDVPSSAWYAPYVQAAVKAGIVDGTSPTTFSPTAPVTREQLAVLLARALKLTKTATLHFSDDAQIDAWALQGVEEAVAAGYVDGFPDGTFQPLGTTTRAQAAKVLAMVLQSRGS